MRVCFHFLSLTLDGQAVAAPGGATTHDATAPVIVTFPTPGTHVLAATWTPATPGAAPVSRSLAVSVVDASFGPPLDVLAWNRRTWTLPGLPRGLDVTADKSLAWNESTSGTTGPRTFTVDIYEPATRHVLARLPRGGAIAARGAVKGFEVAVSDQTDDARINEIRPDGTRVFTFTISAADLPAGAEIRLSTYFKGATFPDGSRDLVLTPADFDANGIARVFVEWGPEGDARLCHRASVYLDGVMVSSEYRALYDLDPANFVILLAPLKMRVNDDHQNGDEEWDKNLTRIPAESDLQQVTIIGINNRSESAIMDLNLEDFGNLSGNYWQDAQKMIPALPPMSWQVPARSSRTESFFVEGIEPSTLVEDVNWVATITRGLEPDTKNTTVYQLDMDVDSNNNGTIDGDAEDKMEISTDADKPGKIIVTGQFKDSDEDAVPDFADGLGFNTSVGGSESGTCGGDEAKLVPLKVELKTPIDPANAEVVFDYGESASIPRDGSDGHIVIAGAGTLESPRTYHLMR